MASSDQLKALIKSHIDRDDAQFFSVAIQLAAHEAKLGHGKTAEELRDMIDAARGRPGQNDATRPIPIGRPRGELSNLLTVVYPKERLVDMVLPQGTSSALHRIIKEQRMLSSIKEHGLSPRRKLLLVGRPGTGKTLTASSLAGELGIPLFLVRLDTLITKYMGETAAKLRQVFDAISEFRGLYFFDEFDAIGSHRAIANDVGEIRRVLNSFLQMLEQDRSNSLIVAATNHPEILDYALFRRFDDVIEYSLPTSDQAKRLIRARLGRFAPKSNALGRVSQIAKGLSQAEICRAVDEAIKEAIMQEKQVVDTSALLAMLRERRVIGDRLSNKAAARHAGSTKR